MIQCELIKLERVGQYGSFVRSFCICMLSGLSVFVVCLFGLVLSFLFVLGPFSEFVGVSELGERDPNVEFSRGRCAARRAGGAPHSVFLDENFAQTAFAFDGRGSRGDECGWWKVRKLVLELCHDFARVTFSAMEIAYRASRTANPFVGKTAKIIVRIRSGYATIPCVARANGVAHFRVLAFLVPRRLLTVGRRL